MSDEKTYFDSDGDERTLYGMVRDEREWACNRIREGEKAIARVAELEAERDKWKASATTLKNLAGLATSTLEAERDARIPVSWIRECAKKWSQKEGALGEGGTE